MNARTHGIYSKFFTPEETQLSNDLTLGSVDHELRLARIRLRRALECEKIANGQPELDEVIEHDLIGQEGSREDRKSKIRDYNTIIDKQLARIESLERMRADLLKTDAGGDAAAQGQIGRIIVEVVSAKPPHDDDGTTG